MKESIIKKLKEEIAAQGQDYQLYDFNARWDNSLTDGENDEILREHLKAVGLLSNGFSKADIDELKDTYKRITKSEKKDLTELHTLPSEIFNLKNLFAHHRVVGVAANPNTAKTSLILTYLLKVKKEYPNIKVYVFGIETSIHNYLKKNGIELIHNKEDILDMKIKGAILFIDEFADVFSIQSRDKQLERIKRFFNRIHHLNNWMIIATAQAGFWNKLMNSLVSCFIVKEIEYDNLVNGTALKRQVLGLYSNSDYRFECAINTYYVVNNNRTEKHTFGYNPELDSKRHNKNPFKMGEFILNKQRTAPISPVTQKEKKFDDKKGETDG